MSATALKLYISPGSAPSRTALFMAERLKRDRPMTFGRNYDLEVISLDLQKGEHKTDEFLALNPEHTVPTLEVGEGYGLWESRAIAKVLVEMAGGHFSYPSAGTFGGSVAGAAVVRGHIDRLLLWDLAKLYPAIGAAVYPVLFGGDATPTEDREDPELDAKLAAVDEQLAVLEDRLSKHPFLLGSSWTLADVSIGFGVTMLEHLEFNFERFPAIAEWRAALAGEACWEEVNAPFRAWVEDRLGPDAAAE